MSWKRNLSCKMRPDKKLKSFQELMNLPECIYVGRTTVAKLQAEYRRELEENKLQSESDANRHKAAMRRQFLRVHSKKISPSQMITFERRLSGLDRQHLLQRKSPKRKSKSKRKEF